MVQVLQCGIRASLKQKSKSGFHVELLLDRDGASGQRATLVQILIDYVRIVAPEGEVESQKRLQGDSTAHGDHRRGRAPAEIAHEERQFDVQVPQQRGVSHERIQHMDVRHVSNRRPQMERL